MPAHVSLAATYKPADATAESGIDEWVAREYRKPKTIKQVNKKFTDESRCVCAAVNAGSCCCLC